MRVSLTFLIFSIIFSAACSKTKDQPPEANFGNANFPAVKPVEPKFPEPKFPDVKFPEARFPDAEFPEARFPEIKFPGLKVQENKDLTIFTLPADILFDFDKDTIRPDAETALQQIREAINNRYPNNPIQINGHTDSIASDAYNQKLSERRADSVKKWLAEKGDIAEDRMSIKGYGETEPVVPNTKPDGLDDPDNRQKNRRVEIVIQKSK